MQHGKDIEEKDIEEVDNSVRSANPLKPHDVEVSAGASEMWSKMALEPVEIAGNIIEVNVSIRTTEASISANIPKSTTSRQRAFLPVYSLTQNTAPRGSTDRGISSNMPGRAANDAVCRRRMFMQRRYGK